MNPLVIDIRKNTTVYVSVCVCYVYTDVGEHTQPFEVPHSRYIPLPHVSYLFEDHVVMIIKATLFPHQTYRINIDTT